MTREELMRERAELVSGRVLMRRKGKRRGGRAPFCPPPWAPVDGTMRACVPNPKYWN